MADRRDNLTRRIARRPFRWFLGGWITLTLLWLAGGFYGFERDRHEIKPPPVEMVPYHKFLPGGAPYGRYPDFNLDPDTLPEFDPTVAGPEYVFMTPDREAEILEVWLVSDQGRFGWPASWLSWQRFDFFDVTDPTQPARRLHKPEQKFKTIHTQSDLEFMQYPENKSANRTIVFAWAPFIRFLLLLEVAVGVVVLTISQGQRSVWRRRVRRNHCLECGYDRKGIGEEKACPECGMSPSASLSDWLKMKRGTPVVRTGRVFLGCLLSLVVLWGIVQAVGSPPPEMMTDEKLAEMQSRFEDQGRFNNGGTARWQSWIRQRVVGWPVDLFMTRDECVFEFSRDRSPMLLPHAPDETLVPMDWEYVYWEVNSGEPTINRWRLLYWRATLTQLAGVQMLAMLLTGIVSRRWAMK